MTKPGIWFLEPQRSGLPSDEWVGSLPAAPWRTLHEILGLILGSSSYRLVRVQQFCTMQVGAGAGQCKS